MTSSLANLDSPAAKHLSAYLDVFNSGDYDALRGFIGQVFAPSALAQQALDRRAPGQGLAFWVTRGYEPLVVQRLSDTEIVVLAQARLTGEWSAIALTVEPRPPHAISSLQVQPATAPDAPAHLERHDDRAIVDTLGRFVERLVAADVFAGTLLVARDGAPLLRQAYGLASKRFDVPNRVDTKFNLGSMNKMFTAVLIARLVERGVLALHEPIAKYVPDWPADVAEKITIHHLLSHTSGIGDYFNARYEATPQTKLRRVADFLPLFRDDPLEFEPGTRWRYSNAGFMLLGHIIETVTGNDYFAHCREHLYRPAGMRNTDAYEMDRPVPNLAIGYTHMPKLGHFDPAEWRSNHYLHVIKGGPAGGGFSTVDDLLAFDRALRAHTLLNAEMTETILTGKVDAWGESGARYAYGFAEERINGQRVVGHGGGFAGINSNLDMFLDSGYTVAVMSNYDPPSAQLVRDKARELIAR